MNTPHPRDYGDVKLDEDGRIRLELPCHQCGYDLRTCEPDAKCPECGYPIAATISRAVFACKWWQPWAVQLGLLGVMGFLVLVTSWAMEHRYRSDFRIDVALFVIGVAKLVLTIAAGREALQSKLISWLVVTIICVLLALGSCFRPIS